MVHQHQFIIFQMYILTILNAFDAIIFGVIIGICRCLLSRYHTIIHAGIHSS